MKTHQEVIDFACQFVWERTPIKDLTKDELLHVIGCLLKEPNRKMIPGIRLNNHTTSSNVYIEAAYIYQI
jgi:hypothetical protein